VTQTVDICGAKNACYSIAELLSFPAHVPQEDALSDGRRDMRPSRIITEYKLTQFHIIMRTFT